MKNITDHAYYLIETDVAAASEAEATVGSITLACAAGYLAMAGILALVLIV